MLEKSVIQLRVVDKLQIKDVGSFPDMDNSVEQSFEIPLLKLELSVHSLRPFLHMVQRRQNCIQILDRDSYRRRQN